MNNTEFESLMISRRDDAQREILMRFFRTAPGQYGEGDEFLGIRVPQIRAIVKQVRGQLALDDIAALLASKWHEVRLAGLLLVVEEMNKVTPRGKKAHDTVAMRRRREELARFYLAHARRANNWDLVDLSCQYILGPYIFLSGDYGILLQLSRSDNLWEQRIAIVTTLYFIRQGNLKPTFEICEKLLDHPHDLIHKAIGWTLREAGKKDKPALEHFLSTHIRRLPRTALRYAIERFPEQERKEWLRK